MNDVVARALAGEYEGDYRLALHDLCTLSAEVTRLQAENAALREALEFYADSFVYEQIIEGGRIHINDDHGRRARAALELEAAA